MRSRKGERGGSRGNRRIGEGKHAAVGTETVTAWSHITVSPYY